MKIFAEEFATQSCRLRENLNDALDSQKKNEFLLFLHNDVKCLKKHDFVFVDGSN